MITAPPSVGQHFAYALGRLGVLEDQLLKETDIDRLLGASTGEDAVKMLRDIEFLATPEADESFQEVLNASAKLVKQNVESMSPPEKLFIFNILWSEGDRPLINYLIKKERNLTSDIATKPVPPVSVSTEEEWMDVISGKADKSHPATPFIQNILTTEISSPSDIDDLVEEGTHMYQRQLAKESGSKAIKNYVEHQIVLNETRTNMRTEDSAEIETIVFEKELIASLGEDLNDMKKVILGPEALFSYAARALGHIDLLRVLLVGKVNGLPIQEIKSLLPPLL